MLRAASPRSVRRARNTPYKPKEVEDVRNIEWPPQWTELIPYDNVINGRLAFPFCC